MCPPGTMVVPLRNSGKIADQIASMRKKLFSKAMKLNFPFHECSCTEKTETFYIPLLKLNVVLPFS